MMLTLLLYAYCVGVFSYRKVMMRCQTDVACRVIVGDDLPNFRRIAEFRKRHLQHLRPLFVLMLRPRGGVIAHRTIGFGRHQDQSQRPTSQSDEFGSTAWM